MTADPFAYDDAAYVLGALDDADRIAFEAHLSTCADCRARVAELRGTADRLAAVPRDRDPAVPDTLLPGLLRRATAERRRRRFLGGAVAAVAAACLIALAAVVVWPAGSSTTHRAPARAFTALHPISLTVTGRLTSQAWGTRIDLHCTYPTGENERFAYDLVVVDRARRSHVVGDWTLVPGKQGLDFTTGTSVPKAQIGRLVVRSATGTALLELRL
jgi:hypothetical protein